VADVSLYMLICDPGSPTVFVGMTGNKEELIIYIRYSMDVPSKRLHSESNYITTVFSRLLYQEKISQECDTCADNLEIKHLKLVINILKY
jgi:hypothetical protein